MCNKIIATVVVISLLSVVTPALAWHGQLSITVDCNGGSARVTPVPSSDVVEQSVSSSSWSWGGKNSITVSGHIKWHYQRNGKWVDEVWNGSQVATKPNGCSTPPSTSTTPASTLTQPSPTQPSIWSPGWAACDWNEKDVPAEQMNDWLFRCSPKQEVTAAKPKVNDCSVQDMILAQVRNGSQTDIWIYRPGVEDGKGAFKVTWKPELKGQNVNASFSPNGCKIVLSNTGRLFVVSIDGSSVERITNTGKDIQPNWASDWSIYFVRKDILTVTDQWGKKPTSLSVSGFLPHASPDAKQIVFINDGLVSIVDKDGKNFKGLGIEAINALWTPNGAGLVYTTTMEEFWSFNFASHATKRIGRPFESRQIVLDPTGLNRMAVAQAVPLESPKLWLEGENSNFVLNLPNQEGLAFPDWWVPSSRRARFDSSIVVAFLTTTTSDLSF